MKLKRNKNKGRCNHKMITLENHNETGCIKCGARPCVGFLRIKHG